MSRKSTLFSRYKNLLEVRPELNRQMVNSQGHQQLPFYGWFRFREAFSPKLVEKLLDAAGPTGSMLDPFAGAGTALFEGSRCGWDTEGIELLPVGPCVIDARHAGQMIDRQEFGGFLTDAARRDWEKMYDPGFRFPHVKITENAFSEATERQIAGYRNFIRHLEGHLKVLAEFAAFSILEEISFTRKDGQYLRWDKRSGRTLRGSFDKGPVPSFKDALRKKLNLMAWDIQTRDRAPMGRPVWVRQGSCLDLMRGNTKNSVNAIITSPPYCNRYDYTRTYALELAYLHCSSDKIKELRQAMLSCTVENRTKKEALRAMYQPEAYEKACEAFDKQRALQLILKALVAAALNNLGIPRMVTGYFLEMSFVIYEMYRVLKSGGMVGMVNDNVRYGGIEIPVDLILSSIAEALGFRTERIWVLPRGKGNSSQQMGEHGRCELRKSICLWRKP